MVGGQQVCGLNNEPTNSQTAQITSQCVQLMIDSVNWKEKRIPHGVFEG
jgi:hypothetical protein